MKKSRWCWMLGCFLTTQAFAAPLALTLGETVVSVTGLSPGDRVALFGAARRSLAAYERLERQEQVLTDDDKDGAVTLALAEPMPPRSVWIAVDLASGEVQAAQPAGAAVRPVPLPSGLGVAQQFFRDNRDFVELLLARPGTAADAGVWGLSAGDGGEGDGDGVQDRSVQALFSRLHPVSTSPAAPEHLAPGDVLVVIDPNRMEYFAARLAR